MLSYWFLFGLQTIGALVMLWKGVPFYRNFLSGEVDPGNRNALWALTVLGLILPSYWWVRTRMPNVGIKSSTKILMGHVLLFFARIVFVFVGGLFSAVFYARMAEIHLSTGIIFLIAILFAMFCYTLELERLGKALIDN